MNDGGANVSSGLSVWCVLNGKHWSAHDDDPDGVVMDAGPEQPCRRMLRFARLCPGVNTRQPGWTMAMITMMTMSTVGTSLA